MPEISKKISKVSLYWVTLTVFLSFMLSIPVQGGSLLTTTSTSAPHLNSLSRTLDSISNSGNASSGLLTRINELQASSSTSDVINALEQINHEKYSNQGSNAVNIAYSNVGALSDRLFALRGGAHGLSLQGLDVVVDGKRIPSQMTTGLLTDGGEEISSFFSKLGVFLNGQIGWGDKDSTILESGFRFNTYEITGGIDYRLTDKIILGAALSYANSDIDINSDGGDSDTDGVTMSLYGTYYVNDSFYIDGIVSLGFNDFDNERRIAYSIASLTSGTTVVNQTMDSDTDGIQQSYSLGCGYDFNHKALTFGPYGRVTYTRTDIDDFTESASAPGAPGSEWRLRVESQEIKSFTSKFGAQAAYAISTKWCVLTQQARVEWVHEFGDNSRHIDARFIEDAGATPFTTKTDDPDEDSLNFGIGISAVFTEGKTAFFDFEKLAGYDDWSSNTVTFGVRCEF